jgi:type II secretory pathway component PulC
MGRGGQARRWPQAAAFVLGAVLALEVAVLVVEALRPAPTITMPVVAITQEPSPRSAPPPSLAQSAARPLFSAPSETAAASTPGSQGPSVAVTQLATRLTLLGIVAGEPGQAIIEDSQTQKTYFVSPGQPVTEGAVVDQVLENEVILSLHGETIRLSL